MKITNPEEKNLIFKLTIPLFFEFLLYILVSNVDQFMLSSYSQEAVAAIGNAGQVSWVMTLFFGVVSIASTVLISQYKGAKDEEMEKAIYPVALIFNVVLGIIISLVCVFCMEPILRLLKVEEGLTFEYAHIYLQIVGGMIVFQAIENCFAAFLKSNALVKEALVISIIVNIFNVAGNSLALYVFDWGVPGVAFSSAISRTLGMLLAIVIFLVKVGKI
ncbi:MAG: MATE family efflux transporter, partial [Bacillota bacterium]|nr:MATE family efflux transporter [Bacillota bacterium]